jgi:hypothetical protein
MNSEALLKDISVSGCCVTSDDFLDVVPKTRYIIDITPEKGAHIEKFELDIESRWIRTNKLFSESGFIIAIRPEDRRLEQYVEYLAKRAARNSRRRHKK